MKTVSDAHEVAHVWAQASRQSASLPSHMRTPTRAMFYDGSTIFSYGYHFAIAHHVTNKKGERAILFTDATYSRTTAKHKSVVRSAIADDIPVFFVPDLTRIYRSFYHGQNPSNDVLLPILRAYIDHAKTHVEKSLKARTNGDFYLRCAERVLQGARAFAKFYSMRNAIPTVQALASPEAIAKAKRKIALQAQENARIRKLREKQEAERQEAQRAHDAERFALWRAGRGSCPMSYRTDENGSAYLTVRENEVETSQGARVPLEHGRRAYRFIKLCRMTGREFVTNGKTVRVGHYSFTSIDTQGNSKIGCHFISWERLEEFAREIGWSSDHADAEALESSTDRTNV